MKAATVTEDIELSIPTVYFRLSTVVVLYLQKMERGMVADVLI